MPVSMTKHVNVFGTSIKGAVKWCFPGTNQVTFFNYDSTAAVIIDSKFTLQPAQVISGVVYPTFIAISLGDNQMMSPRDYFLLDFKGSTSSNLISIHFEFSTQ